MRQKYQDDEVAAMATQQFVGPTSTNNHTSTDRERLDQVGRAPKLAHFYDGKNVLITGVTGFIGKICLLKLVSSFPTSGKVYVMLRGKRGLTPQQRFNKLIQEAPFNPKLMQFDHNPYLLEHAEQLRAEHEKRIAQINWSKVIAINGDMSRDELGLEDDVKQTLCTTVDVIFNIAASVSFDAPIKQNLRDNYLGARNLLKLATKFDKLISLVHVSTFYSNSHLKHVEEKVIPMKCDHKKMAEFITTTPESKLDSMSSQLMEDRPNTYIFTKALSENLVQEYQGKLPIGIVRPSIVVPSVREPEPGWVDNVNGPMGLGVLASLGILRNIDWNYWGVSDFVPVDFVVNSMLVVAERTARLHPNEIKVYNCATSSANPTTWGKCFETLRIEGFKAPPYKGLRVPIQVPKHKRANKFMFACTKLSELLFAYLIDLILTICGQKRLLTRLTSKLHNGYDLLRPFTTNEYTCSNDNLLAAYDELNDDDKVNFDFDIRRINWLEGFRNAYYGARKRLLKEDLNNVQSALFKMKVMMTLEFIMKMLLFSLIGWLSLKLYVPLSDRLVV